MARLRYILTAQRDYYLPLRVIKDQLDAGAEHQPPPQRPAAAALTRRDLLSQAGIGEAQLAELESFGLVRRIGRHYPPEALTAIRAITALSGHGVQPRHLRVVHAAAEREIALIEQVVAPILRQRSPGARERAAAAAHEIAALALQVHAALVTMTLADAGFGDQRPGAPDG